jgi:hypothetical protein
MIGVGAGVAAGEDSVLAKRVGDSDAEPPGKVVVAASRVADRVRASSLSQRGDRLSGATRATASINSPTRGPASMKYRCRPRAVALIRPASTSLAR